MQGRIAAVTGGSRGLGEAIVAELRNEGMHVLNLDLDSGRMDGPDEFVRCDLRSPEGVRNAASRIPRLDLLINNAGVNEISFIEDLEVEVWDRVMGVNARGIFLMTQALLPQLRASHGSVLNITSNAAWVPMTSSLVYNASKAAAHMMTIQMAHEFHRREIPVTVFGIAPGKLEGTPMSQYIEGRVVETRGWTEEFARDYQLASLKAGAETDPRLLARFVAFLASRKMNHQQLAGCILPYGA
jgi:NAD(P)-dependent dehydrogenase (short-subunit alcohol dehydrogenase family)